MNVTAVYESYLGNVLKGDKAACLRIVNDAVSTGLPFIDLYFHVFYPTMVETGELWATNKISVAQEHLITAITQNIIATLYPVLFKQLQEREVDKGKILVACPGEELHELGIRMLADLWELEGWDVTYLGANLPAVFIVSKLEEEQYDLLALSCAISFNVKYVRETIALSRDQLKYTNPIVVGGRIFNIEPELKDYVGADYHGEDFYQAIEIVRDIESKALN